ncbi:MAG: ADP-ribosylglycohydrolase family protein [Syntrophomonadaceae bacterium]|nr:ADP-ribosylglycohydrolase family protein [Syntrophomonadaceae bacterium]
MIGAICGDYIGSVYEFNNIKSKQFDLFSPKCRYTDDTVMTIATMYSLLHRLDFGWSYKKFYRLYPKAGYGTSFIKWASSDSSLPYNSWGNGSAMRVSPVGCYFTSVDRVIKHARESAIVTHNHAEGVKGAVATAVCVHLAITGTSKKNIKQYIESTFRYDLSFALDDIRDDYTFDVSCRGSVPQAIVSFLEAKDYEDTIRNAISIGGDSDTIAAIAGGIAEAYYKSIPPLITAMVLNDLPAEFRDIITKFYAMCGLK